MEFVQVVERQARTGAHDRIAEALALRPGATTQAHADGAAARGEMIRRATATPSRTSPRLHDRSDAADENQS